MDMRRYKYSNVRTRNDAEEIPTIVVNCPSNDELPYADAETNVDSGGDDDQNENMQPARRKSLRRNSISLPNLDDLEVLKVTVETSEQNNRSDFTNSDEDSQDEELPNYRTPLRNARRKSVINPRMLKPPGDDLESGSNSPANSVTSINSLASLLREKIQTLPQTFRKKKTKDYKTRIFVGILFVTIVVLILCAYFLYHQKVLQRAYFEKIKFNKVQRLIKIYNNEGMEIIHGRLGTTLNYDKALPCLPGDLEGDGSICLEWMHRARLYLHFYELQNSVKCYNLRWVSLSNNISPMDCYDMTGHWYGGGQNRESAWPLEKGNHSFAPFITGHVKKQQWGNVLKRYFINSKGAAIIIDDATPLHISIRGDHMKEFCMKAQYDEFAYANKLTSTPHLNYSICTNSNMSGLHSHLTDHTLWDGLKKEEIEVINHLLTEPLWEITSVEKTQLTEETISNYTEKVIESLGFLKQGHVLINEFWQNHIGDFEVDKTRFPTLQKTIEILIRRGFKIVFSIQPFISTESFNFAEAVQQRLLVSERFSDRRIPALTRYKTLQSAGVLDITNNKTIPWLVNKLKAVKSEYNLNAYYLDLGIAYDMPHYYQCEKALTNPDTYKSLFVNNLQGAVSLFGVGSAIERPRSPSFVSLPQFESSWDGLRRVIPTILTYGILGYPFLIPGAIGGDYGSSRNLQTSNHTNLPDQELYIRWSQLAAFLPVVRYSHLPSSYGDKKVLNMTKTLAQLRQTKVTPVLKKYAKTALNEGLPIIRPLWMLDSSDPACHLVVDEFSIGDDLIVAPVLYSRSRQREVYLPAGVWKDGIDSSLRKGSRWIHDYKVEDNEIAYFERMPDDTRF